MSAGYLLDTNVPSETLRPLPHPKVTGWLEAQSEIQFVSVMSLGELRRGASLLVQGAIVKRFLCFRLCVRRENDYERQQRAEADPEDFIHA